MPDICPGQPPSIDPIIRPLLAAVIELPARSARPVMLVEHNPAAVLLIQHGTPDTQVLMHTIDLLKYFHPHLLRQWITPFGYGQIGLEEFIREWPRLTADIAGIVATPDAIPIQLRPS